MPAVQPGPPHRWLLVRQLDPDTPLHDNPEETLIWKRPNAKDDYLTFEGKQIIHGHTPREGGPFKNTNIVNMDVGAVFTGKLAIGVIDPSTKVDGVLIDTLYVTEDQRGT